MAVPIAAVVVAGSATPRAGILALEPVPGPPPSTPAPAVLVPDLTGALAGGVSARAASRAPELRPELTQAYATAVALMPTSCHLRTSVLAAMGQVGSRSLQNHGLDDQHRATPAVYGEPSKRPQDARTPDTDRGSLDGDPRSDRPMGPLAFLVPTWRVAQVDGDDDGRRDPQDIEDAALSAANLLCLDGRDLGTTSDLRAALDAFGHSTSYTRSVMRWIAEFDAAERASEASLLLSMVELVGPPDADAGVEAGSATTAELHALTAGAPSTPLTSMPLASSASPTPRGGPTPASRPTAVTSDAPGGNPTGGPTPHETPTSRPPDTGPASSPPAPSDTPSSSPTCTPGAAETATRPDAERRPDAECGALAERGPFAQPDRRTEPRSVTGSVWFADVDALLSPPGSMEAAPSAAPCRLGGVTPRSGSRRRAPIPG